MSGMNSVVKRLLILSFAIMIVAGAAFCSVAVNHGPQNLAVAWIVVAGIGLTMMPMSGVIKWSFRRGTRAGTTEYGP